MLVDSNHGNVTLIIIFAVCSNFCSKFVGGVTITSFFVQYRKESCFRDHRKTYYRRFSRVGTEREGNYCNRMLWSSLSCMELPNKNLQFTFSVSGKAPRIHARTFHQGCLCWKKISRCLTVVFWMENRKLRVKQYWIGFEKDYKPLGSGWEWLHQLHTYLSVVHVVGIVVRLVDVGCNLNFLESSVSSVQKSCWMEND